MQTVSSKTPSLPRQVEIVITDRARLREIAEISSGDSSLLDVKLTGHLFLEFSG